MRVSVRKTSPTGPAATSVVLLVVGSAAIVLGGPALAHHVFSLGADPEPRLEFDAEDETPADHHLSDSLSIGAKLEFDASYENDRDLEQGEDDEELGLEPSFSIAMSWEPEEDLRFHTELEASREFFPVSPDGEDGEFELKVEEAFVSWRPPVPGTTITVGRQDIADEREWVVDRSLDGIEFVKRIGADFALQGVVARQEFLRDDLLGEFRDNRANNFYLRGYWAFADDSQASLYTLYRQSRDESDLDLLFFGGQSLGEVEDADYWVDAAVVRGEEEGRDILGFGIDLGATYEIEDAPLEPSLTLGFAIGTGDDGKGNDSTFRQSGMHDNSGRFNGVTSFKYYGEALDPDLGNLGIVTAGVGVRPTGGTSIDLVYHRYFQHRETDEMLDSDLDVDPNGDSRDIGQGLDLILGVREFDRLRFEATGGVFFPGDAFDESDPAFQAGIELQFRL